MSDNCGEFYSCMYCFSSINDRAFINPYYPYGCETGRESELPLLTGGLWGQFYNMSDIYYTDIKAGNFAPLPLTSAALYTSVDIASIPSNQGFIDCISIIYIHINI